jgi:hypothetical protein
MSIASSGGIATRVPRVFAKSFVVVVDVSSSRWLDFRVKFRLGPAVRRKRIEVPKFCLKETPGHRLFVALSPKTPSVFSFTQQFDVVYCPLLLSVQTPTIAVVVVYIYISGPRDCDGVSRVGPTRG